ncbi:MAG: LacI family DNA-binding transcriptional regulator [Pseudomonadota bacterium]
MKKLETTAKPTTRDLAREAGVSIATVDRVLNGRSGVRRQTIERVNKAVEELGFVRDISAANLARRRSYRFLFVLPAAPGQFQSELLNRIDEANKAFLSERVHVETVYVVENDAHAIASTLDDVDPEQTDGIAIMAPASPQVRDAIERLTRNGINVVSLISRQVNSDEAHFVGIDNVAAGRTAARLMGWFSQGRDGDILVVCDTMNSIDTLERRYGFDEIINADFSALRVLPSVECYSESDRTRVVLRNVIDRHPDVLGVYVAVSEAERVVPALADINTDKSLKIIAHERTPFTEAALEAGRISAVIAQNPGHVVRSALRVLRAWIDGRETIQSQEAIRIEILIAENL